MKVICERSWVDRRLPGVALALVPDHLVAEALEGKEKWYVVRDLERESDLDLNSWDFGD